MPSYTASQHTSNNIMPSNLNSIGRSPGVVAVVCSKKEVAPPTPEHFHETQSACHGGPVTAFCHQTHPFLQAFRRSALTVLEHWPQPARRAQRCPVLVSTVVNTLLPCDLCDVTLSCRTGRECSRRVGCCS